MGLLFWKNEENLSTGEYGEKLAAKYLKKRGYKILEMNFKNPSGRRLGEIDIIARRNNEIFFVEVKTRKLENINGPLPEESITPAKLYKLNKASQFYMKSENLEDEKCQFDAISVWISADKKTVKIKHMQNIFI